MYYVKAQTVYNGDTLKTHSKAQLATLILAIRNRYRKLLRSFVKSALTASGFFGAEPLRGISTCMRYSQFREDAIRPNDMEHMINRTNVVADICNQMGKKPLMYRQFKGDKGTSIYRFVVKVTPQDNRKWHGNEHNPAQERVIKELGIRNPVWATLEPHTGTRAPFGVNQYQQDNGNVKYSIQLSFDGIEDRVSLQVFKKLFEDIDNKVSQHAFENSNEYFKKKFTSIDVVKAIFTPSIKYPIDKMTGEVSTQWAPKVKIDLEMRKGEFMFQCFDKKRNPMDIFIK